MTINATAAGAAAALRVGRRGAGRRPAPPCGAPCRTTHSRSTSPGAPTSTRRRPSLRLVTDLVALLRDRDAAVEPDLGLRLPHARGGGDRRAGAGLHAGRRHRLRAGGGRRRPRRRRRRRRGCRSSSTPTTTCSRRWPSSGPPGACGTGSWPSGSAPSTTGRSMLRFHAQTGGSTLTAQQPELNVVRVALQALAAVLGGAQSLHTNAFDEALGLPTRALGAGSRCGTQQVVAHEAGVAATVDPLGGLLLRREPHRRASRPRRGATSTASTALGGAVAAIEAGYQQGEIEQAAYAHARAVDDRRAGHRRGQPFRRGAPDDPEPCPPTDPTLAGVARWSGWLQRRARRDQPAVDGPWTSLRRRRREHAQRAPADEGGASPGGDARRGEHRPAARRRSAVVPTPGSLFAWRRRCAS